MKYAEDDDELAEILGNIRPRSSKNVEGEIRAHPGELPLRPVKPAKPAKPTHLPEGEEVITISTSKANLKRLRPGSYQVATKQFLQPASYEGAESGSSQSESKELDLSQSPQSRLDTPISIKTSKAPAPAPAPAPFSTSSTEKVSSGEETSDQGAQRSFLRARHMTGLSLNPDSSPAPEAEALPLDSNSIKAKSKRHKQQMIGAAAKWGRAFDFEPKATGAHHAGSSSAVEKKRPQQTESSGLCKVSPPVAPVSSPFVSITTLPAQPQASQSRMPLYIDTTRGKVPSTNRETTDFMYAAYEGENGGPSIIAAEPRTPVVTSSSSGVAGSTPSTGTAEPSTTTSREFASYFGDVSSYNRDDTPATPLPPGQCPSSTNATDWADLYERTLGTRYSESGKFIGASERDREPLYIDSDAGDGKEHASIATQIPFYTHPNPISTPETQVNITASKDLGETFEQVYSSGDNYSNGDRDRGRSGDRDRVRGRDTDRHLTDSI